MENNEYMCVAMFLNNTVIERGDIIAETPEQAKEKFEKIIKKRFEMQPDKLIWHIDVNEKIK